MNARAQIVSAWLGVAFLVCFAVGFLGLAHFIPPPSPALSAQAIAHKFQTNTTGIRLGMLLVETGAALLLPWCAAIAVQMKRVEGGHSVLTYTMIAASGILVLEFIYPVAFILVAAFRPHESDVVLRHLDDLGWITLLGVVSTAMVQGIVIGIICLKDTRERPVFPRWFGYYSIWTALAFFPASLVVFFKHGPFAWNGLISFWLVAVIFFVWILVMTRVLIAAVRQQQWEESQGVERTTSDPTAQIAALAAEVAELRRELHDMRADRRPDAGQTDGWQM